MTFLPCDIHITGCQPYELGGTPNEGKIRYARYNADTQAIDWHRQIKDYFGVGGAITMRDSGAQDGDTKIYMGGSIDIGRTSSMAETSIWVPAIFVLDSVDQTLEQVLYCILNGEQPSDPSNAYHFSIITFTRRLPAAYEAISGVTRSRDKSN